MIGGPVVLPKLYDGRNKTFFFFVYSGFRFRQGAPNSVQSLIPLDYRQGDFSRFGNLIYDPATTQSTPNGIVRQPFPNNRIPADRISPISAKVLAQVPNPGSSALFNNYIERRPRRDGFQPDQRQARSCVLRGQSS